MGNTRLRTGFRAATAIAAIALPLTVGGTAFAGGDNGDVKVHDTKTDVGNERDDPKVCQFYLDAFNFDKDQQVHWEIDAWAANDTDKGTKVLEGTITAATSPTATATQPKLPDGQYKLFWNFVGENGAAKHKVFKVDCGTPTSPSSTPTSSPSSSHSSPSQPSSPSGSGSTGGTSGGTTGGTSGGTTGGSTGGTTSTVHPTATTPATPASTSSTGSLAHTGADGSVLFIAAGAVALGGGGFALRRYAVARTKA